MEGSLLGRLFKGIFKFVFSSLLVGSISLIASTSFMTGKFPPDWKHIKNMLGTVQKLKDMQKNQIKNTSPGSTDVLAATLQNLKNTELKNNNNNSSPTGYEDPELADVRDLVKRNEKMRNVAAALSGEKIPDSPANGRPNPTVAPIQAPQGVTDIRFQNLEAQVEKLSLRVKSLTSTIVELSDKVESLQKSRR